MSTGKYIFLTDIAGRPNKFGIAYVNWFYTQSGPTFVIYRKRVD